MKILIVSRLGTYSKKKALVDAFSVFVEYRGGSLPALITISRTDHTNNLITSADIQVINSASRQSVHC